jgi:peptide/nickel transport system ATP-binding protein
MTTQALLSIRDLRVGYLSPKGLDQLILDGVDLDLAPKETLALVGESGCGKSTLAKAILRTLRAPAYIGSGKVIFDGKDVFAMSPEDLRRLRWGDIAMIVQSALDALNPVLSLEAQFADVLRAHTAMDRGKARRLMIERLEMVGLSDRHLKTYPHEMSGGMRQRAVIAMALLLSPKLLLMDEPTTALDVVTQGEILGQIRDLQRNMGFAIVLITHDLPLAIDFSDRIAVMYAGRMVEIGPSQEVNRSPHHHYTAGLLRSFPHPGDTHQVLRGVPGYPVNFAEIPEGCAFHPRCGAAVDTCRHRTPTLVTRGERSWRCSNPPTSAPSGDSSVEITLPHG